MTFTDIPTGASVFIDANTLVYHFLPEPLLGPACADLLDRCWRQELLGFTSAHVLIEMAHRLMTLEAMAQFGWPASGIARRLRTHPTEVRQLVRFRDAVQRVTLLRLQVLPVTAPLVSAATAVSQQHGLLSGDALLVATMHAQGLVHLASHDEDFDRVPGLTRYAPA